MAQPRPTPGLPPMPMPLRPNAAHATSGPSVADNANFFATSAHPPPPPIPQIQTQGLRAQIPGRGPPEPPAYRPAPLERPYQKYIQVPQGRKPRAGVQTIDLRKERVTEARAIQLLSSIVVKRIQKRDDPNELDNDGNPVLPSWEVVDMTEETDISQKTALQKVQQLEEKNPDIASKKHKLNLPLQQQIEKAQQALEAEEPDGRFMYFLRQLDSKIGKIAKSSPLYGIRDEKKKKEKKKKKKKWYPGSYGGRRTIDYERVSVTMYFQRAPRPDEDAVEMLRAKQRSRQQPPALPSKYDSAPPPLQHPLQPPSQPPSQPQPWPAKFSAGPGQPNLPNMQDSRPVPPPAPVVPAMPAMEQPRPRPAPNLSRPQSPRIAQSFNRHPPDTRAFRTHARQPQSSVSSCSTDGWDNSDAGEYRTAESSIASGRRPLSRSRRDDRSRRHQSDRPENYGQAARQHRKDNAARPAFPSPPSTQPSPIPRSLFFAPDIEAIKREAYRDGVGDAVHILRPRVVQQESPRPSYRPIPAWHDDELELTGERPERVHIANSIGRGRSRERRRDQTYNELGPDRREVHNYRFLRDDRERDRPTAQVADSYRYLRREEDGRQRWNPFVPSGRYHYG